MNLTSKQNEIVRFIWDYRKTHGIAPTLSEIADELGVSKITVHEHISLLEKKRAIKKEKYQSRSLKLSRTVVKELEAVDHERERLGLARPVPGRRGAAPPKQWAAARQGSAGPRQPRLEPAGRGAPISLPLLGKIAAGSPIEALEDEQELDIAQALRLDRASYALRVRGDSMIDDGIHDGDFVLVERRTTPRDGETVVAVLEGNEATLKRFYKEGDQYKLVPANPRLLPMTVEKSKLEIRGVVVGQLRRY
ncbi:transcriptional repressor LexA [bacterium]|nr:transcriptional repressor LexA [bacterium]